MTALVFDARRDGYSIEQVSRPMTVGQLKELLQDMDDDTLFILSHDGGYTYGSVSRSAEVKEDREGDYGTEWETVDEISVW